MSYSFTLSGSFQGADASDREQRVHDLAAEFVREVRRHVGDGGVTSATFSGQFMGFVDFDGDSIPPSSTPPDAEPFSTSDDVSADQAAVDAVGDPVDATDELAPDTDKTDGDGF